MMRIIASDIKNVPCFICGNSLLCDYFELDFNKQKNKPVPDNKFICSHCLERMVLDGINYVPSYKLERINKILELIHKLKSDYIESKIVDYNSGLIKIYAYSKTFNLYYSFYDGKEYYQINLEIDKNRSKKLKGGDEINTYDELKQFLKKNR